MDSIYRIPPVVYESDVMSASALSQVVDWGVKERKMPEQWEKSAGEGVLVVVCDTGAPRHKDLPPSIFEHNFTASPVIHDRQAHQTHVSGIIGARNNDDGVVGWAPKCDIGHCKVLGDNGAGQGSWIAAGIRKAISEYKSRKADYVGCVINLSIGGPYDADEDRACREAEEAGIIVCAAAGNSGAGAGVDAPGMFQTTLAIAAYRADGEIARFSSGGPEVDFAMPGDAILSTVPNDQYQVMSGTSMATPAAAGLIACALSSRPNDKELRHYTGLKAFLATHAEDRGSLGKDNRFGLGVPTAEDIIQDQDNLFI